MPLYIAHVDRPAVHRVTAPVQRTMEKVLRRVLLAAQRGVTDQLLGKGDLLVEALRDGLQNACGQGRIERHPLPAHSARDSAWVEQDTLPPQKPT
jgi:hypothetical protein